MVGRVSGRMTVEHIFKSEELFLLQSFTQDTAVRSFGRFMGDMDTLFVTSYKNSRRGKGVGRVEERE